MSDIAAQLENYEELPEFIKKQVQELRIQAERDSLTQFYNKRNTERVIYESLAKKTSGNCALLILDIDNFKKVNDTLGHLFGDSVLIDICSKLRKLINEEEILGRVGGDEFVIFLPKISTSDEVIKHAEVIRSTLYTCYGGDNYEFYISCSVGAYIADGSESYNEMFRKADLALYLAKTQGRNCFRLYDDSIIDFLGDQSHSEIGAEEDSTAPPLRLGERIFNLLYNPKDFISNLNLALAILGQAFNADRTFVFENIYDDTISANTFEWCSEGIPSVIAKHGTIPLETVSYELFFSGAGILHSNRPSSLHPALADIAGRRGTQSIFAVATVKDGNMVGFVGMERLTDKISFSPSEQAEFTHAAGLIGLFILKKRMAIDWQELRNRAYIDEVTGLPTILKFKEIVRRKLLHAKSGEYTMISFDVDNFKFINDAFGFGAGNEVLRIIGKICLAQITPETAMTRESADNFLVFAPTHLCLNVHSIEKEVNFNNAIRAVLGESYQLKFSIGVYTINDMTYNFSHITDCVYIAKKYAKLVYDTSLVHYTAEMQRMHILKRDITMSMERALREKRFLPYFQPKHSLADGKMVGAEVLCRWPDQDIGMVSPSEFIPIFEKNGFIVKLDLYMFAESCRLIQKWLDEGVLNIPKISVNISKLTLLSDGFTDRLSRIIRDCHVAPSHVELELTESVLEEDSAHVLELLRELKAMGFYISIDDFGSGYSSLSMLNNIVADTIKLDKTFLTSTLATEKGVHIINMILNVARELNFETVAEGLETKTQVALMREMGCDIAQGYYFSRPVPAPQFFDLLEKSGLCFA